MRLLVHKTAKMRKRAGLAKEKVMKNLDICPHGSCVIIYYQIHFTLKNLYLLEFLAENGALDIKKTSAKNQVSEDFAK